MITMVRIERGIFIVDCPREECHWAYHAISPLGTPRYLHKCVGTPTGPMAGPGCGAMMELVWPAPDEAEAIVEVLSKRSLIATRNWLPGETPDSLLIENERYLVNRDLEWLAENGIGVVS